MKVEQFRAIILDHYRSEGRVLPWRETEDPYHILLSEIMLQQTQVPRVLIKYESWIRRFPTFTSVATASTKDVLDEWKGLGYNRRALAFKRTCEIVHREHGGKLPEDVNSLLSLPGVGPYTARAVRTFAWNYPEVFIETNIRSVFIHFFCNDSEEKVHDKDIIPLIEKTLDHNNPREWHWALMDYGSFLKKNSNPSRKSAHHTKQTPFKGSNREARSKILEIVSTKEKISTRELFKILRNQNISTEKFELNLEALVREGFLRKTRKIPRHKPQNKSEKDTEDFYTIEG